MYVADTENHRIQRFRPDGEFLGMWGQWGGKPGQMASPFGIAVSRQGLVYVADHDNHRIQVFSQTGEFIGQIGRPGGSGEYGLFRYPQGVAIREAGRLYVVDTYNQRIQAFGLAHEPAWHGELFANEWLAGRASTMTGLRGDNALRLPDDAPAPPAQPFSVRWYRYVMFPRGIHVFLLEAAGGARMWVDDQLLIDSWDKDASIFWRAIPLSAGEHLVRVEHVHRGTVPSLSLHWAPADTWPRVYFPLIWKRP